jgi:hypothetical protein
MHVTRRKLLGTAAVVASAALPMVPGLKARAQEATPAPAVLGTPAVPGFQAPGYGIARVRVHQSAEIAQAVYADVLTRFLPPTAALPGFYGYVFAFDDADPGTTLNFTFLNDAAAVEAANTVAQEYVAGMDARLSPQTPIAEQGAVRIYQLTDRPVSELPPLLHGCHITVRYRKNAADTDIEGVIRSASEGFGPIQAAMDGFVMYGWMHAEGGRVSFNVWETAEQMQAGNEAVAAWGAANPVITEESPAVVHNGVIGYSDLLRKI